MATEAGPVNTSSSIRLSSGGGVAEESRVNDHHLTEKLKEEEKIEISREKSAPGASF